MISHLLLALGLSACIGASSLQPSKAIEQYQTQTYVETTVDTGEYGCTNANIGFYQYSMFDNYEYTGARFTDFNTSNRTPSSGDLVYYRAFFFSNGNQQPTWVLPENTQDGNGYYNVPNDNNYFYGYFVTTSDNFLKGFYLRTGGSNRNTDFMGGKYWVSRFVNISLLFDDVLSVNQQTNNVFNLTPNDWTYVYNSNNGLWYYEYSYVNDSEYEYGTMTFNVSVVPNNEDTYNTGFDTGYTQGYNNGYNDGANSSVSFFNLFSAIADTPVLMLRSLFNFELFGINLLTVVLSLISGLMVFYLIRKFIGL